MVEPRPTTAVGGDGRCLLLPAGLAPCSLTPSVAACKLMVELFEYLRHNSRESSCANDATETMGKPQVRGILLLPP